MCTKCAPLFNVDYLIKLSNIKNPYGQSLYFSKLQCFLSSVIKFKFCRDHCISLLIQGQWNLNSGLHSQSLLTVLMHNFPITKHNTSQSADWKIAYSQSNSSGNSYLRRANGQWDSQLRELIDRRWCWTWAVGQLPLAGGPILWVRSTSTFWELPHKLNPELLQLKTET